MRRSPGPEPERARQEVRLEDRLNHDLHGSLHDPVADRRDRERTKLLAPGLRDEHPARGKRTPAPVPSGPRPAHRAAGRRRTARHRRWSAGRCRPRHGWRAPLPRPLQDVPAVDLVVERVEPSSGIGLGRPVKRSLQFSDFVLLGGPSHDVALTGPSLCVTRERSSGPSLTAGSVVPSAQAVLRPPPTPSRPRPLPGSAPVIGRRRSDDLSAAAGPGRASPVPAATF